MRDVSSDKLRVRPERARVHTHSPRTHSSHTVLFRSAVGAVRFDHGGMAAAGHIEVTGSRSGTLMMRTMMRKRRRRTTGGGHGDVVVWWCTTLVLI